MQTVSIGLDERLTVRIDEYNCDGIRVADWFMTGQDIDLSARPADIVLLMVEVQAPEGLTFGAIDGAVVEIRTDGEISRCVALRDYDFAETHLLCLVWRNPGDNWRVTLPGEV